MCYFKFMLQSLSKSQLTQIGLVAFLVVSFLLISTRVFAVDVSPSPDASASPFVSASPDVSASPLASDSATPSVSPSVLPSVSPSPSPVAIRGNVYNVTPQGLRPLSGLLVTVSCPIHNKKKSQTVTTDVNGLYTVNFSNKKCDPFSQVKATTSYNGQTTTESVFVSAESTATLNFYF